MADTGFHQFSKAVWDFVNSQAWALLERKQFVPDGDGPSGVRCVYLEEETEQAFGRQIWFFEAYGRDMSGRRRQVYGALDFTIEYGLLVPHRAMLLNDAHYRQRFLEAVAKPASPQVWNALSTRVWVRLTLVSCVILAAIWLLSVAAWLMQ